MSIIGVVVLAELIVVLTGGIDISVGSALGLAAVVSAGLFGGPSVFLALLVALVIGGIVGAVNGWLVAFRGLEPFIVTLGMLALARGLVYAYGNGIPINPGASASFAALGQATFIGIPVLAIIWLLMVALIAFLLYRTVWGRRVYAIGSNKEAARSSGIPVKATLWSVYILAGLLVGLGGWMFLARFASGTSTAGNLLELEAIAAVVIGGARLSGGLRQGVRGGGRHHHLRRDRQSALPAERLHLPAGRFPRRADPGRGDAGHGAVRPPAEGRLDPAGSQVEPVRA